MKRVLILGGGFGGIATAVALRAQLDPVDQIVLVDRRPSFVMGLRKNWALVGETSLAAGTRRLADLERGGITVVQGSVTAIHPADRAADVDARRLEADALVVALGAEHDADRVPGFREFAIDAYDPDATARGREAIERLTAGRVVIGIFGVPYPCPPGPFELAMLLVSRFARRRAAASVTVFSPLPLSLPMLGSAGCATVESRLAGAGIEFLAARQPTAVVDGAVQFGDDRLNFDLLLGVPPHRPPAVVTEAGMTRGGAWISVDRLTLETDFPGVYAIGDVTAIPLANGQLLPKAGVFAEAQGKVVAERVAAGFAGRVAAARFSGEGACFFELGAGTAVMIAGRFLADPPEARLTEPGPEHLAAKRAFEADRLRSWFGR
ncbi:MAG: FAD-dependent oxidoreductase [Chloroflexota bacterium]